MHDIAKDFAQRMERTYSTIAEIPQIKRGQVWCRTCGYTQRVDGGRAIRSGWPMHCGYTMTLDSPEERAAAQTQGGT